MFLPGIWFVSFMNVIGRISFYHGAHHRPNAQAKLSDDDIDFSYSREVYFRVNALRKLLNCKIN